MATVPDMSMFGGAPASSTGPDMSMFNSKPKPQSKLSNIGRGIKGAYTDAVMNNLIVQPVRFAMEKLNYGGYNEKIRKLFPGQTDEWYEKKIHDLYTEAVDKSRQKARKLVEDNPYPGHIVPNTVAAIVGSADPTWLIAPGTSLAKGALEGGAKKAVPAVAKHIGKQATIQGAVGGASDAAAQGLDIASGQTRDGEAIKFDPTRLATSAALGAGFGGGFAGVQVGVHNPRFQQAVAESDAPDFVKGLFLERGRDTTPNAEPFRSQVGQQSPALAPENAQRHNEILRQGTPEQINQFYDEIGGPRPSPESVDQWIQQRDAMGVPATPKPKVIEAQIHRDSIKSHIDNQTANWKNKPTVNVIDTLDDMSPEVRSSAEIDGITPENTVGFMGADGQIHIFANQVKTPEAANAVLYHEALGHYGLAQRFGTKLDKTLQTLVTRNVGQFGKKVDRWVRNNPGAYGGNRLRAAEEVLAEMSQAGPLPKSIGDAIVSGVRQFGRRMGLDLKYSDAEVNHILAMAHNAVINGKGRDVIGNRFGGLNYQATDFGTRQKTVAPGEQLGVEADNTIRDLTWGETPRDRLIRAQRTLSQHGGDHPEARRIADEASDELGLPRVEEARVNVQEPELAYPVQGVGDDMSPKPANEQAGLINAAREEGAQNVRMTPEQLQEHIDTGDEIVKDIEQAYDSAYQDREPTYRSDAEVRRAAQHAGVTPSAIKKFKDIGDLSTRIERSKQAAEFLKTRIGTLLEKEGTPQWSAGDQDALRKAIIDHSYILNKIWDDKSELGRALRLSKMGYADISTMESYKELLREHGGTFAALGDDETLNRFARSLKQLMAGPDNPNGVNAMIKGLQKPHWEDYLTSFRMNMMLSGLSTHVTAPLDMVTGIGLDLLDNSAGLVTSLGREGLRALGFNVKQGIHPAEVAARFWGILRAAMDASTYVNAASVLKEGSDRETQMGRQTARIPIISKVGDLIAAEDQFFRAFSTNMHLYGLGVRKAVETARAAGKSPSFDDLLTAGTNHARYPSKELLKEAQDLAERDLLLAPNPVTSPLDAARRAGPDATGLQRAGAFMVNFLLPFVRTQANSLYQRVWRRTPLTMIDPATIRDLKEGGAKADVAMGRIMLGSAAVAYAWYQAGQGNITGQGPDNPNKKAVKMGAGWRPQAVKNEGRYATSINLGNRLNPFDPHSQTAIMIAGLREAFEKGANQGQVATGMKMAMYTTLKSLAESSWVGDITNSISTLTDPGLNATDKRDQFVANQIGSFTPNLLAQIGRVTDQGQPMTSVSGDLPQTIANTVKSRIPGLRNELPDRMTPFGEAVQSGASLFSQKTPLPQGNRITGGNYVEESSNPAIQEIARLDDMFKKSVLTPVKRTVKIDGEDIRLTNEEFSNYQREAGTRVVSELTAMMSTPEWAEMSDEDKAQWVHDMQIDVKKEVRGELFDGDE